MRNQALISLILLGTIMVFLATIEGVHASKVTLINEHHPASPFMDSSGTYDGYMVGQTVNWHIHLNVTALTAPFPWLSISNLTFSDTFPNLAVGGPLYMTYVSGSQNSSSAAGPATFTDFGNGTLLWNFGTGPFATGVLAPPSFSNANEFYTASVTFNATILGKVSKDTLLTNTGEVTYVETVSRSYSVPAVSDTIWAHVPNNSVPQDPSLVTPEAAIATIAIIIGMVVLTKRKKKRKEAA